MDKEKYYQMCNDMNTEPVEDQIPQDYGDFILTTREVYDIFIKLPDIINSMTGDYMGKELSNIFTYFHLYGIEEDNWLLYIELLNYMIEVYTIEMSAKIKREVKAKEAEAKAKGKNGNTINKRA